MAKGHFAETVFADDLNCWKRYKLDKQTATPHEAPLADLNEAQRKLHLWGQANQVLFDPGKESFHILPRTLHHGDNFKVLGCLFGSQLCMLETARHVATEAGWRLKNLLRVKRFFTTPEVVRLYKAQILSYVESSTPALYHAAPSTLDRIDRVQRRFLRELGLSELEALRDYRLAPLEARRDMGMLGALHKVNLNRAPLQLQVLFPRLGVVHEPLARQRLRRWRPLHNKQLATPATRYSSDVMRRSLFGLVHCYNTLPQRIVDASSVKQLQKMLQGALLHLATLDSPDWQRLFGDVWRRFPRTNLDELFL